MAVPGSGFFGLVALGDEHVFKSKLLTNLNLSSKKLADVEKAFDAIDTDGNGFITTDEVRHLLSSIYEMKVPPEHEVKLFMSRFDKNKDGKITKEEFLSSFPEIQEEIKKHSSKNHAKNFKSLSFLKAKQKRHARLSKGPREMYSVPVTTSMEVGWQVNSGAERNASDPYKSKGSCKETRFAGEMIKSGIYY